MIKKNKILSNRHAIGAFALMCAMGFTHAAYANAPASPFNGFVSFGTGVALYSNKIESNYTSTYYYQGQGLIHSFPATITSHNNSTGVLGDLSAGVTYHPNKFIFALVADASINSNKATLVYNNTTVSIVNANNVTTVGKDYNGSEKMPYSFGLNIQPGLFISPNSQLYLTGGVRYGKLNSQLDHEKLTVTGADSAAGNLDGSNRYYNGDLNKWLCGYEVGAGFKSYFSRHWGLKVEYDFIGYQKFNVTSRYAAGSAQNPTGSSIPATPAHPYTTTNLHYHPYMNEIKIGVTYSFRALDLSSKNYLHPVAWLDRRGLRLPGESAPGAVA